MTRLTSKQLQTAVANGAAILNDEPEPIYTIETAPQASSICKVINMPAFGKKRPRVTKNGTYMPREYMNKKTLLRFLFGPVPDGLVRLSVTAVRAMPKSWSNKKKEQEHGRYAKPKPDLDNIIGAVMDALFKDDDVVVAFGPCAKIWGDKHQLIIELEPVGR